MALLALAAASLVLLATGAPESGLGSNVAETQRLSPDQLFTLADAAQQRADWVTARTVYEALMQDPDPRIRREARFRLGMMASAIGRLTEAALLFRQILDEEPGAQRVRLELARVLDRMGDEAGARRALREAQAAGLPPDVARVVDRYSLALRARKPFGGSFEFAFAPDTNINRATRSPTLGTVIGDFTLDPDARERSGIGLAARGQVYARASLGRSVTLLARLSGSAELYRQSRFNDVALAFSAGPEIPLGADRLNAEAGIVRRWFGGRTYSQTATLGVNYQHQLDRRSQLRAIATLGASDNRRNPLQDGRLYALSLSYERAVSDRAGFGATLAAVRESLKDPAYSTSSGQLELFGYRDFGATTLVATLACGGLVADRRLFIYPSRRDERLAKGSLTATFRQLRLGSLAPYLRVTAERNRSTIELFDYRRLRFELGVARAF